MKKFLSVLLVLTLLLSGATLLASCGDVAKNSGEEESPDPSSEPEDNYEGEITIVIPNDPTNEARALLLLDTLGIIEIDGTKGITATVRDIVSNPKNIRFVEMEAAQVPNKRIDADFAIINSNYALAAGLKPTKDSLAIEGSDSSYNNILVAKEGNENSPKILALKAALASKAVKDYITSTYGGAVVSVVDEPNADGFDASVDYEALKGTTITVAASPTPHAEILQIAKNILATKEITLNIKEYTDYIQPNNVVESGEVDANYFQHIPYLDSFNADNGTHLVSILEVHVEPMAIYGGRRSNLNVLTQ